MTQAPPITTGLQLSVGNATLTGPRERNEDFHACVVPETVQLAEKGALLVMADGVSGGASGREAAEYAARGLLTEYYATPDTWGVIHSLDKVLTGINRWLNAQANSRRELAGMSSTLSTLVLRGKRYYTAHVGDSRIYLLRAQRFEALTNDHVWDTPGMQHVLKRAIGMDQHVVVDFSEGELQNGDVFLLVTDGVWEPLGKQLMHDTLRLYHGAQWAADELVRLAHRKGGQDNASAIVIKVEHVQDDDLRDQLSTGQLLPVPRLFAVGGVIDDFEIQMLLHQSRNSVLYQVRSRQDGRLYVLKTLPSAAELDTQALSGLLHEEWLAKRVVSHYFPQILPLQLGQRSALYYVMSWHAGATLQQLLDNGRHFSVSEAVQIGIRLLKGLATLYRLDILHRDIKPANLHWGDDDKLRILDLGVASAAGQANVVEGAGTPSFMAPELLAGQPATVASELYAVGVTLYYLLTRHYPYGEIEPFQQPTFTSPVLPTRYRPEVPSWLENLLLKSLVILPSQRFETAEEMLLALENGERNQLARPRTMPLLSRGANQVWKLVAVCSLVLNGLLIYLVVAR